MCILWFHARAGYLQTYETVTLLKEINFLSGSDEVQLGQYAVECVTLADCNFKFSMSPVSGAFAILHC